MKLPSNLSFLTVPGLVLLLAVAGRAQGSDLKDAVTKTRDPACTGKCKPVTWTKDPVPGQPSRPPAQPRPECTPSSGKKQWHDPDDPLKPGDVNCRMWTNWYDDDIVEGEHTCEKLAGIYDCSLEKFYMLNPVLDAKCDLKPFTQYCVTGCMFLSPVPEPQRFGWSLNAVQSLSPIVLGTAGAARITRTRAVWEWRWGSAAAPSPGRAAKQSKQAP